MRPKKVILLVDGNEAALGIRRFMLETRGYRVLTAASAGEALVSFDRHHIDLVVSDLLLPDMHGDDLIRMLKTEAPKTRALLFSLTVREGLCSSFADVCLRSGTFSPARLLDEIKLLLIQKRGPKKMHGRDAVYVREPAASLKQQAAVPVPLSAVN